MANGGPGRRLRGRSPSQVAPRSALTVDGVCIRRRLNPDPPGSQYGRLDTIVARGVAKQATLAFNQLHDSLQTTMCSASGERRTRLRCELAQRRRRVAQPELRDLGEVRRQRVEVERA